MAEKLESPKSLSLTISDKKALYRNYMPFLRNGGLFVVTNDNYKLGEEISISLSLMDEPETITVNGEVAWISPVSQSNKEAGIGIHFNTERKSSLLKNKIEKYLQDKLHSSMMTNTM